ncbi:hypothetical protein [Fischerella thermalis]|nr:hypothetical protein [Fischerella thermalis]
MALLASWRLGGSSFISILCNATKEFSEASPEADVSSRAEMVAQLYACRK